MSEKQLTALLVKLKEDMGLLEKLKGAPDLDAAVAMAQEAGFDISKEDWFRHQSSHVDELSDLELESVAGGIQAKHQDELSKRECSKRQDMCA
jgi:predicted ribosomally synthesized peptide with nif11-like leader